MTERIDGKELSNDQEYGEDSGVGLEDVSDRDRSMSLLGRGDLPPIDYEAQLRAFHLVLRDQKAARARRQAYIEELEVGAKKAKTHAANEQYINDWCWELQESSYEGAMHSMAIVSMLAPLFEAVFCRAFTAMGAWYAKDPWSLPKHARWAMKPEQRQWDCHFFVKRKSIVDGIVELADATGLRSHLPNPFEEPLRALFRYRNAMFHNGLEWPADELMQFASYTSLWPAEWFESAMMDKKPAFFYASDVFVDTCLSLFEQVIVALGKYVRCNILGR